MEKIETAEKIRQIQQELAAQLGVDMTFFQHDPSDEEYRQIVARDFFSNIKSRIAQKLAMVETAIYFNIDAGDTSRAMQIASSLHSYTYDLVEACLQKGGSDEA